jgi:threonine dehydrogenase-like Zn-dependent dehydrogenase
MKALRLSATPIADQNLTRSKEACKSWKNPKVTLEETPSPTPGPGELLLQVEYCGLCGSDYHLAESRAGDSSLFYPGLVELPVTIGHEFSGKVVAHGPQMSMAAKKNFPIGAIVTAEEMLWCGECGACRSGQLNHCENLEELGFTRNGAHAEFVSVHSKYCWSLEPLVKKFGEKNALRIGALVEPYSVSYRALFQGAHGGKWLPGDTLLIFGAGPIGLAALDLALTAGAAAVHVVEQLEERQKFAKELGAEKVFSPEDLAKLDRYDWIIDAAGTNLATQVAATKLNVGGSLCFLARSKEPCLIQPENLITNNSKFFGSQGHSGESAFPRVITLMAADKLRPLQLILEEIDLEAAEKRLRSQEKIAGKILVRPGRKNS